MAEEEDSVSIKFRLYDGSDIGPNSYPSASTVSMLKERIIADWPKDKKLVPRVANDVKLISAGKILENTKTVGQCRVPFGDVPGEAMIMHVVVQPSPVKTKREDILLPLQLDSTTCEFRQRTIMDSVSLQVLGPSMFLFVFSFRLVSLYVNARTSSQFG